MKERAGCVCVLACVSLCMCVTESVFIFGLSGLILFIDSLSLKKTKQKIFHLSLLPTQWDAPCPLSPSLALHSLSNYL